MEPRPHGRGDSNPDAIAYLLGWPQWSHDHTAVETNYTELATVGALGPQWSHDLTAVEMALSIHPFPRGRT